MSFTYTRAAAVPLWHEGRTAGYHVHRNGRHLAYITSLRDWRAYDPESGTLLATEPTFAALKVEIERRFG